MKRNTIGLDLAKTIFHVVVSDHHGKLLSRKQLRRHQMTAWFAQQPVSLIGIEACAGSHYWARTLQALGHEVKLIAPQHVKAYLRGQKNDYNDAAAIAEAVTRPQMHFVPIKSPDQLDLQALNRLRKRTISERTGLSNQLRGLLGENGIVMPRSLAILRRRIPELLEQADNGLSVLFRRLLQLGWQQLLSLDEQIKMLNQELARSVRTNESCQRLMSVPGFGPVTASSFSVSIGDGHCYRRGRDVSASLGVVPRQHSTGGKPKLLGISKCGDRELRANLIQGARSVLMHAKNKQDPLSRWAVKVAAERGFNKATVAVANKLARIGWAVIRYQTVYQPEYRLQTHK